MTREEAIKTLKENYCAICAYGSPNMESCDISSCDNRDAIKALEQEPISDILEDIYTEIEDEYEDCVIGKLDDDEMYPCFRKITDIYGVMDIIDKYIDKYKAESEGKE